MRGDLPVTLTIARAELARFNALLQRGVAVPLGAPRSVLGFLVEDLGLTPDYVRQRITTVFLDGQVVDVLEDAILRQGSRLALSAAMPGLVGATLRRSGPYAAMRAEITRTVGRELEPRTGAATVIEVALFNLLIDEIGPLLLERGVLLDAATLGALRLATDAAASVAERRVELRVRFA